MRALKLSIELSIDTGRLAGTAIDMQEWVFLDFVYVLGY